MGDFELYEDDLRALIAALQKLPDTAGIENVHGVTTTIEFDGGTFVTIGYGESGDPCVIAIAGRSRTPRTANQEPSGG